MRSAGGGIAPLMSGELQLMKAVIDVAAGQEFLMGALLHDSAAMQDKKTVSLTDGGEPVSDNQRGTVSKTALESLSDQVLGLTVYVCRCLI